MKVIIAGSRHMADNLALVEDAVVASKFSITEVVSGCARGADKLGERWANLRNLPVKRFPADWNNYGKAAGPVRNRQMRDYADALIVFIWDKSRGSENMLRQMEVAGKPVFVVRDGRVGFGPDG